MKLGRLLCSMSIHGIMRREEIFRKESTYPERLKNEENRVNAFTQKISSLLEAGTGNYYSKDLDVELDYGGGHKVIFLADSVKIEDGKLTIKAK